MTFKEFRKELSGGGVESEIIKTIFVSLLTSLALLAILYFFKLRYIENFISRFGIYLFFAVLSYAVILPAVRQVRAFKEFPCMSGMMIGMTIGMISGFLPGFYTASTNGMFYGGFFGVALGIIFGVWNGKCCGIMGAMEGMMAGFMGGLMGAMTAFMLLNDHLKIAAVLVFVISTVIMLGLNYMIYKETREIKRAHKDSELFIIVLSFILTAVTTWLVIYGPRGGLLA